jgi:hypothetical protein
MPDTDELRQTVERLHCGIARLIETIPVDGSLVEGNPPVDGVVHVFELTHNPQATRAYAWWSRTGTSTLAFSVLHVPPISSAVEAFRTTMLRKAP